ncbi:MAG: hypothetical protein K2X03_31160 [Bryobacteraceae bacterium]|nr:hypothetical protein [Bryobacteraceae bacterium]
MDIEPKLGLAISGGGIRSATFALGILQGLAKRKFLTKLDYLSTVSGGGYIGAWLSVWAARSATSGKSGIGQVEEALHPEWSKNGQVLSDAPPLGWLRAYGNFLSPQLGLFSADTWLIFAIWSRNTLLNLCVLIPLLLALLCLPWVLLLMMHVAHEWMTPDSAGRSIVFVSALFTLLLAAVTYALGGGNHRWSRNFTEFRGFVPALIVSISATLFTIALWRSGEAKLCTALPSLFGGAIAAICIFLMLKDQAREWRAILRMVAGTIFGGVSLHLAYGLARDFLRPPSTQLGWMLFAAPVFALADCLILVGLIGFAGRRMQDEDREGWSRAGAWIGILGLFGIVLGTITYWGPLLVAFGWQARSVGVSTGALWAAISAAGTYLARGESTSGDDRSKRPWLDAALPMAGLVFIIGLLILLSFGVFWVAGGDGLLSVMNQPSDKNYCDSCRQELAPTDWGKIWRNSLDAFRGDAASIAGGSSSVLYLLIGCTVGWLVLGRIFSINDFSMFSFYRNRLVRAYLGASNVQRDTTGKLDRFTDLCPGDDVPLTDLTPSKVGYTHLICTAANVNLERSGFAERKAVSFVFDHEKCEYHLPPSVRAITANGGSYTQKYPRTGTPPTVGTAITISGAAASPNMGYHSSPILAFLMTLFNVRLGYWMFNPSESYTSVRRALLGRLPEPWEPRGPKWGTFYYLFELLAQASSRRKYIYLSDGGHFENLGLYELLRRRVPYIIVIDGESDPSMKFEALASVIRKARSDFGIEISIDTSSIEQRDAAGWSSAHAAVGQIQYPDQAQGCLLYLKLSVTGDEPQDILNFRRVNAEFPHQSTADQFFSESQFESYRRLGLHVADKVFVALDGKNGTFELAGREKLESVFGCLRQTLMPIPRAIAENFTRHTETLKALLGELQTDPLLDSIAWQITRSQARTTPAADTPEFRASFFFAQRLLQLMEDVYFDLQLETNSNHLACAGWMKQFRDWARSEMVNQVYGETKGTFTAAFQSFFDRQLADR